MARKTATLATSLLWLTGTLAAQGLNTTATKDDWEDINFETNSPILSDGYPSLLRLAELLNKNSGFRVKLVGHADSTGSHPYNDKLGMKRAEAVKAFLEKYGARPNQVSVTSSGARTPKADNGSLEGRFINRRVDMTVTDDQGRVVAAGGPADAIKAIEAVAKKQEECCSQILRRLDKLDEILAAIRDLKNDNAQLRRDLADLKGMAGKMSQPVAPSKPPVNRLTPADMARISDKAADKAFTDQGIAQHKGKLNAEELDNLALGAARNAIVDAKGEGKQMSPAEMEQLAEMAARKALQKAIDAGKADLTPAELDEIARRAARRAVDQELGRVSPQTLEDTLKKVSMTQSGGPVLSILGFNEGVDGNGQVTFTGKGRLFKPLSKNTAVQAQGEYLYFKGRKEGQGDVGVVHRHNQVQVGAFSSFKGVSMSEFESTGVLGQAAFTADYLFKYGRVGAFGTKSFLNNSVVLQRQQRNFLDETYLSVVDQLGASTAVQLHPRAIFEGNLGWLRRANATDKPGGTLRFVFPLNKVIALTAEGGFNETLVGKDNNGRATFGVLFGNYLQPREFLSYGGPVPVDIPRVRYEVLTRRTRTGNDPPVADAGTDRTGVPAGQVQLDGSGSFDPDGDPIRFTWTQVAGPAVSIANASSARATFTAAEGQQYGFRLTVTDSHNAQGVARVSISTRVSPTPRITRFLASPDSILPGGSSILNYNVENADSVTISGVTAQLNPRNGSASVSPTATTTYTLTARNGAGTDQATLTVVVDTPGPRVIRFQANPASVLRGQTSTLSWQVNDAESVQIVGVGTFQGGTGTTTVQPNESTPYTLIATSRIGQTTAVATVTVIQGDRPRVLTFTASPMEIPEGQTSVLNWNVEGAREVSIDNNVGRVQATGSANVQPARTTTYTLTATNDFGVTRAVVTVTVFPKPKVISFTALPTTIFPGQPVTFTWETVDSEYVFISGGIGNRIPSGSLTNAGPTQTQTYTLTAVGRGGQATAQVTVTVTPPQTNVTTPVARVSPADLTTSFRELVLNGTPSFDPQNRPLTYSWRSVDNKGTVVNPTSATPTVRLNQPHSGSFVFELQVTNDVGLSSKALVTVTLIEARPLP